MGKTRNTEEEVMKRLNAIVYLLTELTSRGEAQSGREKIRLLHKAGLDYKEIAELLGKTPNHVAVELNALKREK